MTYLHRSTNAEQPFSINARRLLFPRWSRFLIQNISQKCSRDDHKMTLGGLHGRGMVHSSGVGAPMVPRGQVIHHQQRCRAQQRVVPTISQLSRSGEFHLRVLRGGAVERHRGHRSVIYARDVSGAVKWRHINLHTSCDVPATLNQRRTTTFDQRAPTFVPTLVSFSDLKHFPKMLPGRS